MNERLICTAESDSFRQKEFSEFLKQDRVAETSTTDAYWVSEGSGHSYPRCNSPRDKEPGRIHYDRKGWLEYSF